MDHQGVNYYMNYSHNNGLNCTKRVHSHLQLSNLLWLQCKNSSRHNSCNNSCLNSRRCELTFSLTGPVYNQFGYNEYRTYLLISKPFRAMIKRLVTLIAALRAVHISTAHNKHFYTYSIQPMDDQREENSIHQIPLQLMSTGLIGTFN